MFKSKIYIAADHGGFELKAKICTFLKEQKIAFEDLGTNSTTPCDYADFAHILAQKLVNLGDFTKKISKNNDNNPNDKNASNHDKKAFGILICGSGIGISIAANRHKNIRCALCNEPLSAMLARKHNDANVLALGGRLIGGEMAFEIIKSFLNTEFEGGRHIKRIEKIENIKD